MTQLQVQSDPALVDRCLQGSREAFAQIVGRYQSLVCSVTYSATGSVRESEDLAQETFLTAWRQLPALREPQRLRAWLCGIARNLAHNLVRREQHEPSRSALPISHAEDAPALHPAPSETAIRDEEQRILWSAIGRIPEAYREPLVLFYREHHSIENVAQALELSTDTVKQRLSRGRKLLQAEVLEFVEGALERCAPGKAFTLAVLAALPALGTSNAASAAIVGAIGSQGVLAKSAGLAGAASTVSGPLLGLASATLAVQMNLAAAPTAEEKALVWRQSWRALLATALYVVLLWALILLGRHGGENVTPVLLLGALIPLGYAGWLWWIMGRDLAATRQLRAAVGGPSIYREYRSSISVLGWPLLHVRDGTPPPDAPPVRGWIAIGDHAVGLVFALGQHATGLIALGGIAVGGLAIGGVSVGVVSIGGVAFGLLSVGGTAFGGLALAGYAMGWSGAGGGIAIAGDYANGGYALAPHANDAYAQAALAAALPGPGFMLLLLLPVLTLIPTALYARRLRRRAQALDGGRD